MDSEIDTKLSIYKAARSIKRRDNTLYNALRSIYEDSTFVGEISQLWPELPLLANLRCGFWYYPKFDATCYFKSTDGHTNNWSFNTSRLNLHVAQLAGQKGGCIIVDSTRRGKRFPDSMSKTIPSWTCVLNRAILNHKNRNRSNGSLEKASSTCHQHSECSGLVSCDWDSSLHLPLWVSATERAAIEDRLEEWTRQLEACGADIASLVSCLRKPLRPLWISQKTVIWLNEVPGLDSWDFTPIILVSASSSVGISQHKTTSEFSWNYIPGAGDDEESWARGLSPHHFWKQAYDLISSGPDVCNQKVADIIERDRVYRAQRGQSAPQVSIKPAKLANMACVSNVEPPLSLEIHDSKTDMRSSDSNCKASWLGSTNLAVGTTQLAAACISDFACILNCDQESASVVLPTAEAYLHLPMVNSKMDRFSLSKNLPSAIEFAKLTLEKGKKLLVCCRDGEDISVCVCLAILASLFDGEGSYLISTKIKKENFAKSFLMLKESMTKCQLLDSLLSSNEPLIMENLSTSQKSPNGRCGDVLYISVNLQPAHGHPGET
ncbi:tRNA A64-2'-O-ribosylphosphate transferase isoform X2 [Tripterygium wilfordii]|uniref:tRNA A64-2'-O-ribosylphosphate transferase isoform X2 n=1 Tax=Tripterygium wilfordii TaxID=458696 RepID=UPI0018F7EF4B|nr:tRNA A64-2'-O-ribosylphosphate transferase isoform X2 [Tripterygium wilfordii]